MVPETRIEDGVNCSGADRNARLLPDGGGRRIKAIRGTFDHYEANTDRDERSGERVEADIAVLAIGYKLGVPFLPAAASAKLVDPGWRISPATA